MSNMLKKQRYCEKSNNYKLIGVSNSTKRRFKTSIPDIIRWSRCDKFNYEETFAYEQLQVY